MNNTTRKILNEITLTKGEHYLELNRGNKCILLDMKEDITKLNMIKELSDVFFEPMSLVDFYLAQLVGNMFTLAELKCIKRAS